MATPSPRVPVLVVGGGPTGLVLALVLLKNGVPVRVIQKDAQFHVGQRGAGIQPRTLEAYNLLGVLPDIMEQGMPLQSLNIYKLPGGVEPVHEFWLVPPAEATPSTPFINAWMIGQAHAEEILRSHLAKYGVHVELSTELTSLEQHEDHVSARLIKQSQGDQRIEENVQCDWLVGADGGRGIVRKLLGLTFLGEALTSQMVLGEIRLKGLNAEHWHGWGDPAKTFVLLRPTEYPGVFSYLVTGKEVDFAKIYSHDNDLIEILQVTTNRKDIVFGEIVWKTDYRPSVRMVNKFSEGRVFVAGDAAHVHSPTGGQGMNSSVQDALNLGWKLALVHKGLAPPSLLSTYNEERLPVVKTMLEKTTGIFHQTFGATGPTSFERFGAGWSDTPGLRMLGVNYRWSSIVVDERASPSNDADQFNALDAYGVEHSGEVRAGDRAPDAPGLLRVDEAKSALTSLLENFGASYHTLLVFSSDPVQSAKLVETLQRYPESLIRVLVVYPQTTKNASVTPGAYLTLLDQAGHAYGSYAIQNEKETVVVVRPDGVIGAIVFDQNGLSRYLKGVFLQAL